MSFNKELWVVITKCDSETAWYKNKVGTIQKVSDELFPPDYTLISKHYQNIGLYPQIKSEDVKLITPALITKFLKWINYEPK